MQSNFQFLKDKPPFRAFAEACLEAEKGLLVSPATCAILTRRALELSVKWVYSHDRALTVPYSDKLSALIADHTFRAIVDEELLPMLRYIRDLGNVSVHSNSPVTRNEAVITLHHLHQFVSWIDYCYADQYTANVFDESLLQQGPTKRTRPEELQDLYERLSAKDRDLKKVVEENQALREQLGKKREQQKETYDFEVDALDEVETRKRYIDVELKLAGWDFQAHVVTEMQVQGMPTKQGKGFVDYVLFGDDGKPVALIEAKRTTVDAKLGQQQAKLYADCLETQYGRRPIIFYSNGYEIYLWDDISYPPRRIFGFYTQDECARLLTRRTSKRSLQFIHVNEQITNRYYQKDAIRAVCEALSEKQRKALLVMATGSGKTRTAISLVDVLMQQNWVKNILFLADRKVLVKQAKAHFHHHLPGLTLCNLLAEKDRHPEDARMVFSTYKTMMNAIDETQTKRGKRLFTVGHFDLIIIDEAHRSIYKKYQAIFQYFDGYLLGLTATPKDDIDRNTYTLFDLENGVPTHAYELKQAVKDGYLVDYGTIETELKIPKRGIRYDELPPDEQEIYEETFSEEEESTDSSAINQWIFNDHTIDLMLRELMEKGEKIEGGDKLGKTIIFASNHLHAERIVERFNRLYPKYHGEFARVIAHKVKYHQTLIDQFSGAKQMPQIAVSVDMLDTGVDIPEVVNLVFAKKVRSKSKFWQMVGRGTRLCPDLYGIGADKTHFKIFDYGRNFDFFRADPQKGKKVQRKLVQSLTEKLFMAKVELIRELQAIQFQEEKYIQFREQLVQDVMEQITSLSTENFRVRQQLRYIHKFGNRQNWVALTVRDGNELSKKIAPLLEPLPDEELIKRFDLLFYRIELAKVTNHNPMQWINKVVTTVENLAKNATIPQISAQKEVIQFALSKEFWQEADLLDIDYVREQLRELVVFVERKTQRVFYTNFTDEVLDSKESEAIYQVNDLKNYRKKVHHYLQEHHNHTAVYKLRHNKPLTTEDVQALEKILWNELGTKEDYHREFGDEPVAKLVRRVTGLDPQAANEAFSQFLSANHLTFQQSHFVKLIVDFVVKNGVMDTKVLQEEPFKAVGSIVDVFKENMDDAKLILSIIDQINRNSEQVTSL